MERVGDGWKMINGDALRVLSEMPSASVDMLLTDPPYSSGGMVRGDRMASTSSKYVRGDVADKGIDFTGDNRDQRGFVYWCSLWLAEARRVLRPRGWAIVFSDWRQMPAMTDAIQAGGFLWKGIMTWHKPAHRRIQGGVSYACEYAVVGCNGPVDQSGPQIDGFHSESPPSKREHQTQKPVGLMRHCLGLARPGSVILDPFVGSATTGVAARMLGHYFIGIELSDHYYGLSCRRMAEVDGGSQAMQPGLFGER